tara:strand:+ start:268 stop:1236 length:969 start_codon:yes stop_codon:yes gene_type:complete
MSKILVTGGAGYIGSHVCKLLKKNNYEFVILDNLSTGKKKYTKYGSLEVGDLRNKKFLEKIFSKYKFKSVIHLAAKCLVSESQKKYQEYYDNNVVGTINLLDCITKYEVNNIIFSSSCAVYGDKAKKINENEKLKPINVYGETKKICEEIIKTYSKTFKLNYIILRYFNAAGADIENEIGEDRRNETHLIPLIFKAIKKNKPVNIFGKNYNTKDRTCIRDYVHVLDIARAHLKSLKFLNKNKKSFIFNLGTGFGLSVLDITNLVSNLIEKKINIKFVSRRKGDPPSLVANPNKIKKFLKFKNKYSEPKIIIKTAWQWFKKTK